MLFSSGRSSVFLKFLLLVLGYCTRGGIFGETMSLPLPSTWLWTFHSLFLSSCSARFLGKYSICNYRFGVSMVGGEFRIFLCCHLLMPLTMWNLSVFIVSVQRSCVWSCYLVFMEIHNEAQLICYTHLIPILNGLVALIIIICTITIRIKKS